jgi:hypothetical protein
MSAGSGWQEELAALLRENGHSDEELAKIMQRVRRYESEMQLDSVMASIGDGSLDLAAIVREALGHETPPNEA